MVTKYILSGIPYNLDDIPLGSLVPKKSQPNQDAYIPATELRQPDDFDWRNQENSDFSLDKRDEASINAWLTQFLELRGSSTTENRDRLWSKEDRIYDLKQPRQLFISLCKDQAARQWLEARYNSRESVYMVVGYRTFRDARSIQEDETARTVSGKGNVPVGQMAGHGVPADGGALDVKLGARAAQWRRTAQSFCIKGERIFAICFRKVRYDWFSAGNVDRAQLTADNQWVVALRSIVKDAAQVMEVTLEDESDVSILDESQLDDLDDFEDNEGDRGEAETKAKEIQFQAAKESGEDGAEFYLPRSDLT